MAIYLFYLIGGLLNCQEEEEKHKRARDLCSSSSIDDVAVYVNRMDDLSLSYLVRKKSLVLESLFSEYLGQVHYK